MAAADKTLGQLVGQVLRLQRHLTADIQGNGVWPVLINNAAQAAGSGVDGLIDAHPSRVAIALLAHKGMLHAPCIGHGLVARTALRAQATKVARVLFVSGYFDDEVVLHLHHNSAANPTVRTHAAHGFTGAVIRHLATSPGIS